ncbi:MFS general substrate transporter [Trametes cingulata]|nr:MFS general substrate transporter [Trametes cingulata]
MSHEAFPPLALETPGSRLSDRDSETDKVQLKCEVVEATAPQHDEPIVTRKELWSYYLYYNGDNGVGPLNYSLTLFLSLANAAGFDPAKGPGSSCSAPDASGQCVVPWAGGTKSVNSIILIANGASFAIMTLLFTTVGSVADYGNLGRWVLLVFTVVCWAAQFAGMSLTAPDRWSLALALYMIGFVTYGATLVFYAAIFPRLARNTPHARELKGAYERAEISADEYEREESMEMNRISNISTTHSNIGCIITLALNLTVLLPKASDPMVNNYVLVLTNGYWVLLGIWWFIYQRPRPGPQLPKGEHYATIGWKQIWSAFKQYRQLPYTFIYLAAFFLLADGFNTTGTVVLLCQNDRFQFSFLQNTYLGLVQAVACTASTLGFWYIQRYWTIPTKKMFAVTNVATILIPLWGMIGIWTTNFGFHNVWEFWAYNVISGLFQAPYYAFSQTMMAELTPPGFDNMFFGLFGLSNRASSLIGPNVVQAIIDGSGNTWMGFPFLFALCTLPCLILWWGVDMKSGRRDALARAEKQPAYIRRNVQHTEREPVEQLPSKE